MRKPQNLLNDQIRRMIAKHYIAAKRKPHEAYSFNIHAELLGLSLRKFDVSKGRVQKAKDLHFNKIQRYANRTKS